MKEKITASINDPEALEKCFRENRSEFIRAFKEIAPGYNTELVKFWKIRLKSVKAVVPAEFSLRDLLVAALISLITALLSRVNLLTDDPENEMFYLRNFPLIAFTGLIAYTLWQKRITSLTKIIIVAVPVIVLALFLNLLPAEGSDTAILSFIHAPLLLWSVFGLVWVDFDFRDHRKISAFIRYNGELIIMGGILLAAGGLLAAMTISLFSAANMEISEFYAQNLVIPVCAASPVITAWLTGRFPNVTSRIAPLVARVFSPLVTVSALVYLVAVLFSGIHPVENREVLILFNLLLLAVMAIIVFSTAELEYSRFRQLQLAMLILLSTISLTINIIAVTAISTRLASGLTPNRLVVVVTNSIVFLNLLFALHGLLLSCFKGAPASLIEKKIAGFLPVYFIYTVLAIFALPFVFNFR